MTAADEVYEAYLRYGDLVSGGHVTPGWILGGPSFWYADGGPNERAVWVVDPATGSREPLCDVTQLRKALTQALGHEPAGNGMPFSSLQFLGEQLIAFSVEGISWTYDLADFSLTRGHELTSNPMLTLLATEAQRATPTTFALENFTALGPLLMPEAVSPDGQWFASVQDNNIALRASVDGKSLSLTTDGTDDAFWHVEPVRWRAWSPDSQRLAVFKVDCAAMARIPTIHWLKRLPQVEEVFTIPAGGVLDRNELYVLDVLGGRPVQVDLGDTTDTYLVVLGWLPDGSELLVARYDRLFSQVEVLSADPRTGAVRKVLTERSETFLTNHHWALWGGNTGFRLLPDGSGFLWRSERDGWAHLYRYDLEGNLVARLTEGEWPVLDVTVIDQAGGWVYFQAHGEADRPYDNHLYRVPLDGGDVTRLTDGLGRHEIAFAPSCDVFVDNSSSVGTPPCSVLRTADGREIAVLDEADTTALEQVGFVPSQEYVVKAADGVTDLWVTLHFPYDFDPSRTYPLIEQVYGGPQVAKRVMDFGVVRNLPPGVDHQWNFHRALAQHGFLVMTMDGRGTPGRSKAFHDAVYRGWGTYEVADHAGAVRQLAERLGFIDLDRVAVTGGSWGGQLTFRALVDEPELYRYGIAEVPGYDSRAMTLYEPYLGMPADNKELYDVADALPLAPRLRGRLLQTGGTNDTGTQADFYRMSEALVRAGIQHDTMAYPNTSHGYPGATGRYNNQLKLDWFRRHLQPGRQE